MISTERQEDEPTVLADLDAERQVLATVLIDNGAVERLGLSHEQFFDASHAAIWKAATEIVLRGESASFATLGAALPSLQRYIARLPDVGVKIDLAPDHARTVRDLAARRRMVELSAELRERAGDTSLSAEQIAAEVAGALSRMEFGKQAKSKRQVGEELYEFLARPAEVFPTGLSRLDEAIGGGLIGGKCYGIGARKKVGKTLLLGTISHNLNRDKVPHLFVALEMSDDEIEQRNIAREMGFNAIKFLLPQEREFVRRRVGEYVASVPNFTDYEHIPGASFDQILAA